MARYAVAVDVGGTFTDLIAVNLEDGSVRLAKVPSTPPDFFAGVIAAVSEICSDFADVALFLHGTTAHLNAFLERKGAHSALVTTRGFATSTRCAAARGQRRTTCTFRSRRP